MPGILITALLGFLLLVAPAAAQQPAHLPRPDIEYQADITMNSGALSLSGTIHYTPGKEWRQLNFTKPSVRGRPVILRRDMGLAWILDEAARTYVQFPINQPATGAAMPAADGMVTLDHIGDETIGGVPHRKFRATFAPGETGQLAGTIFVSQDNIVTRIEGVITSRNGSQPYSMILSNIRREAQDPSLFELPQGYRSLQPGLPAGGQRPAAAQRNGPAGPPNR